jgi:hypothetical protein
MSGLTRETLPYWRATTEAWAEYPPSEERTPWLISVAFTSSAKVAGLQKNHSGVFTGFLCLPVGSHQPFCVIKNPANGCTGCTGDSAL